MSRWDQEYRQLSPAARTAVNELVNAIFSKQTGFGGKIDLRAQPRFAAKWIGIRNDVLKNKHLFSRWLRETVSGVRDFIQAVDVFNALDTTPAWIRIARDQLGQEEIKGKQHNPRIMEYIRTCTNIQETRNQRIFVEREGEERVEWCSAFVNWCLLQVGIGGTNHALASSWKTWGDDSELRQGAIVGFSWKGTKIDHVAFCDEVGGQILMLGGNQDRDKGVNGIRVSRVGLNRPAAKFYRFPPGA